MKKIEATIQVTKIKTISDAITGVVGGFTIIEGNGRGSGFGISILGISGVIVSGFLLLNGFLPKYCSASI